MNYSTIDYSVTDRVLTLTLNRPDDLNSFTVEMAHELIDAFNRASDDDDVGAIIVTGAGRAFCAGYDLKELAGGTSGTTAESAASDLAASMADFRGPIIGAINGHAVTGGFELALACDVLIASENARFADTHARVGILPGWGLSQLLPRLIGASRAKEISFSGNFIDAQQALDWGLVNRVVAPEALLDVCHALAGDMISCVPDVLMAYKGMIDEGLRMPLGPALEMEASRAIASAAATGSEDVAARRDGVMARGRQKNSP